MRLILTPRFVCHFSSPLATVRATERLTLGAMRTTRRKDATLVQLSSNGALDSDAVRLAALISRLQQRHPVEIVQFAILVGKRASSQGRDTPQCRILGPQRGISDQHPKRCL